VLKAGSVGEDNENKVKTVAQVNSLMNISS